MAELTQVGIVNGVPISGTGEVPTLAPIRDKLPSLGKVATGTLSSLNSSDASAQLLPANADRVGAMIHNSDVNTLYIKYGTTATTAIGGYTVKIAADGFWEMPQPIYTGRIDAIWSADGDGGASITEW